MYKRQVCIPIRIGHAGATEQIAFTVLVAETDMDEVLEHVRVSAEQRIVGIGAATGGQSRVALLLSPTEFRHIDLARTIGEGRPLVRGAASRTGRDGTTERLHVAVSLLICTGAVDILVNSPGVNFRKRYWAETDGETFDKGRA